MGYITSATTTYIDLHMTSRGRKFLLQGSLADQITQFALSDVDKDYRNGQNLPSGFVPDVTGSHLNCIFGVNDGYELRDKITWVEGGGQVLKSQQDAAQMYVGYTNPGTGEQDWTTNLTSNVYLHDILSLFRVAAFDNIAHHNWADLNRTTFTDYFSSITDSNGKAISLNIPGFFEKLEAQGKTVGIKVFDNLFVKEKNSYNAVAAEIKLVGDTKRIFPHIFGGAYITSTNKEVTDEGVTRGLQRQASRVTSPFTFANNTYIDDNGRSYPGAGKCTISLWPVIDFGYMVGSLIENVTYYQEYGFYNDIGGMYNQRDIQTPSFSKQLKSDKGNTLEALIPMARAEFINDPTTNGYMTLGTTQINNNSNTNFVSEAGNNVGSNLTQGTAPLATWSQFMSGTALAKLRVGGRTFDKTFTPIKPAGKTREPWTGLSWLIQEVINFFEAVTVDPTTTNVITKTGSGLAAVYNLPLQFQVCHSSRKDVKTATININLNLNLASLFENYTYISATGKSISQVQIYDATKPTNKFYGDGSAGFTTNPLDSRTSSTGTPTFIKNTAT